MIKQTDTRKFKELQTNWREGAEYMAPFYSMTSGESCADVTIVREGFGIIAGKFKTTSGAFSPAHGDDYHDDTVSMHPDSARYVKALVNIWKRAGPNLPKKENHKYSLKK